MMKFLRALIVLPPFFVVAFSVHAQDRLVEFDIGSLESEPVESLAPSFTAPNLSAGSLARQGVVRDPYFTDTADDADGLYGAGEWPTSSEADPGRHFEFTMAPEANFSLLIDSLQFGLFTENTQDSVDGVTVDQEFLGPTSWDIAYSLDGFATSVPLDTVATPLAENVPAGESRWAQYTFHLVDLAIAVPEGGTISFRFAGYNRPEEGVVESYGGFSNASGAAPSDGFPSSWEGTGSNLIVDGAVIPEPSQFALAFAGLTLLTVVVWRRRRAVSAS